jgi:superfamily II DNA helicase RecQ
MTFQVISEEQYNNLLERLDSLQKELSTKQKNPKEVIYDSADLLKILNISKSTLQRMRDEGLIGFSQVQGKFYYRQSDINEMLDRHYKPPFK